MTIRVDLIIAGMFIGAFLYGLFSFWRYWKQQKNIRLQQEKEKQIRDALYVERESQQKVMYKNYTTKNDRNVRVNRLRDTNFISIVVTEAAIDDEYEVPDRCFEIQDDVVLPTEEFTSGGGLFEGSGASGNYDNSDTSSTVDSSSSFDSGCSSSDCGSGD